MKKTIIALFALAGIAAAETYVHTETIDASDAGATIQVNGNTYGSGAYLYDVTGTVGITQIEPSSGGAHMQSVTLKIAAGETLTATNYIKLNNKALVNFTGSIVLGENAHLNVTGGTDQTVGLQFNSENVNNSGYSTTGIITLGQGATISASSLDFVNGQSSQSLTINGVFSAENMGILTSFSPGNNSLLTTNLITLGNNGVRHLTVDADHVTLGNISALDDLGYTNAGLVTSSSDLQVGQYGLLYTQGSTGTGHNFQLVGRVIPEPATATLSLLALAGLAARRRRK